MVNSLLRQFQAIIHPNWPSSIGIAVKTGKIAAGNIDLQPMPGLQQVTGSPQVNGVLVDLARRDE